MYTWILIIDNFVQIDIFLAYMMGMGRRQVVRQRLLMPSFAGSIPAAPAKKISVMSAILKQFFIVLPDGKSLRKIRLLKVLTLLRSCKTQIFPFWERALSPFVPAGAVLKSQIVLTSCYNI